MPSFAVERTEVLDALHEDILAAVHGHQHLPDSNVRVLGEPQSLTFCAGAAHSVLEGRTRSRA